MSNPRHAQAFAELMILGMWATSTTDELTVDALKRHINEAVGRVMATRERHPCADGKHDLRGLPVCPDCGFRPQFTAATQPIKQVKP